MASIYDSKVAHNWAHQEGRTSYASANMFYSGRIVYSYGSHFPIARLMEDGDTVLFTLRSYSSTTATHKQETKSAVSHKRIIYCDKIPKWNYDVSDYNVWSETHDSNIKYWMEEIKECIKKLPRARKKEKWVMEIDRLKKQMQVYLDYFGLTLSESDSAIINCGNYDEYIAAVEQEKARIKQENDRLIAIGKPLIDGYWKTWRAGLSVYNYTEGMSIEQRKAFNLAKDNEWDTIKLRCDNENVYTSKSVDVPIPIAHRAWQRYHAILKDGGCKDNCGDYKILQFTVSEVSEERLVVGCHDIPRTEIDYIANLLNWTL